jgi:peptide/nickel transport system permease protein
MEVGRITTRSDTEPVRPHRRITDRRWARLFRDPAFWIGATIVFGLVAGAIVGPALVGHDPNLQYRVSEGGLTADGDPVGPGGQFLLGTDKLGRDELARLIAGAQTSMSVALSATLAAAIIGSLIGGVAGFAGNPPVTFGWGLARRTIRLPIETGLMRLTDIVLSLPAILLALALAAVARPSQWVAAAVIAAILWTATARIVYGRVLDVKRQDFVLAAEGLGVSPGRVLTRHVWPHVAPLVLIYATLGISAAIIFEATLSYLGAGAQVPTASWGSMISDHRDVFAIQPRLVLLPGLAIVLAVLGFNLLGDAFRDAFDPGQVSIRESAERVKKQAAVSAASEA